MSNKNIEELSELTAKESALKRYLDVSYYDKEKRTHFFNELREVQKKINLLKFKINLERKQENEKSR